MQRLGHSIRILRQARGLNSAQLAAKAGISPAYLSLIESESRVPPHETLLKLAAALGVDVALFQMLLPDRPATSRSARISELASALRRLGEAEDELKRKLA